MRCLRAKRPCSGYEEDNFTAFRQYGSQALDQVPQSSSMARKCRLPKREPIPGTETLPEDIIPPEVSQAQSNTLALRAFFYDYCITSSNNSLSRGFLSSLETMTQRLGPESNVTKACLAVSFASHWRPMNRPVFLRKAEAFYQELLGSLAKAIDNPSSTNIREAKLVALLLGLYQVRIPKERFYYTTLVPKPRH